MTILRSPLRSPLRAPLYGPLEGKYGGAFTPTDLFANGEQGGWYDPSDLSTLFQDAAGTTPVTSDSDPVGRMEDLSGNDNHLTQSTGAARPVYHTDGALHWVEGDGLDDYLRGTFAISQPWDRLSAFRIITHVTSANIFNGASQGAGQLYMVSGFSLRCGSGGTFVSLPYTPGVDYVATERHNGAGSRAALNDDAYVTGDFGTTLPGGVTLLANTLGSNNGNVRFYGAVMINRELTPQEIDLCRAYFATKAGVTL